MNFVSYAQNLEDVMLYRALRDVTGGFYIDVGAQDPVIDSVTKAFYDRGWHGINIEPNEEYFHKLQSERPHDLNLATAVGREPGDICFYEVAHTGLSTTNAGYAQRHSEAGYQVERREVPCTTLDRICADCAVATVHFLKIDVEGSEREVLEGFSFEMVRPWLLIVEATEPNSDHEVFTEWEDLLLGRGYRFIYFDGLNRFYAAEEHADLARHFSRPPNWFDQYISYQLWRTRADLDEVRAAERNALVNSVNHMLAEVQGVRAEAEAHRAAAEAHRAAAEAHRAEAQRLRGAMAEREQALQEAMAEHERQLGKLQGVVAERDRQLGSLHEAVAERDRQLGSLQTNLAKSQQRLKSVRSSISWKITGPLREVRRAAVRIIGLFRRPKPPSDIATSALANSDMAVPDEIAAGLTEPARLLYRNLRDAAAFQRRTEKKRMSGEKRI
jgi:FkbM family methyltransferase